MDAGGSGRGDGGGRDNPNPGGGRDDAESDDGSGSPIIPGSTDSDLLRTYRLTASQLTTEQKAALRAAATSVQLPKAVCTSGADRPLSAMERRIPWTERGNTAVITRATAALMAVGSLRDLMRLANLTAVTSRQLTRAMFTGAEKVPYKLVCTASRQLLELAPSFSQ